MTLQNQKEIASTFSDKFEEFELDLTLTQNEFSIFDKGVFAESMDEKWNVFVLDKYMFWARSWTDACIYKIELLREDDVIKLIKGFVTRNRLEYNSNNVEQDKILFLKLLQAYLGRDDIYVDPAFHFDLIKQVLADQEPISRYKKSISRQSVGINKMIYKSVQHFGEDYIIKTGWQAFYEKIKDMNDDEDILSLYLHEKGTRNGTTYHFDNEGKRLISVIVPVELSSR